MTKETKYNFTGNKWIPAAAKAFLRGCGFWKDGKNRLNSNILSFSAIHSFFSELLHSKKNHVGLPLKHVNQSLFLSLLIALKSLVDNEYLCR